VLSMRFSCSVLSHLSGCMHYLTSNKTQCKMRLFYLQRQAVSQFSSSRRDFYSFPRPEILSYLNVPSRQPLKYKTVGSVINDSAQKFGDHVSIIAPSIIRSSKVSKTFWQLKTEVISFVPINSSHSFP